MSFTTYPDLKAVEGFKLAAVAANIKYPDRKDLSLFQVAEGSTHAALFTQNAFCAAPVQLCKKHLAVSAPKYLLVNTGYANAGTGEMGYQDAEASCQALAEVTQSRVETILPFSTGVIGERLPVDRIIAPLPALVEQLDGGAWSACAEAIMTTDVVPKGCSITFEHNGETITLTGIAKGAGMIKPNMATMLAFVATDLAVESALLQGLFKASVDRSFNRITVDGDTSTNDASVIVATGASGVTLTSGLAELEQKFSAALEEVMVYLAKAIVRDGEGATKFVEINVLQGMSVEECKEVGYTVAHSPLVKTALFASDPNWGRILAAVGRAPIESLDVDRVNISLNGTQIVESGGVSPTYTEAQGAAAMAADEIIIDIDLGRGTVSETVWTCDLSYDYVKINSDYRS